MVILKEINCVNNLYGQFLVSSVHILAYVIFDSLGLAMSFLAIPDSILPNYGIILYLLSAVLVIQKL